MNDKTRRELLEEAFNDAEAEDEDLDKSSAGGAEDDDPEPSGGESAQGGEETEDGGKKSDSKDDGKPDSQKIEQNAANKLKDGKPPKDSGQQHQQPQNQGADERPPASWSKEERQLWAQIPKEARAVIMRRELETTRVLQQSAGARRFANEFVQVVAPYAHLIRAQNSTPLRAVDNLMKTAAWLTTGSPEQKASVVSDIINNYGVDIRILDEVIKTRVERGDWGRGQQINLPQPVAQALQKIHQFEQGIEQARQKRHEQLIAEANSELEEFAKDHPFLDDLREDMADLMDIARSRGKKMTYEEAYKKALALRPELQQIEDKRRRSTSPDVRKAAQVLSSARQRAKSVVGAPSGRVNNAPLTRRQVLEQAWDDSTN